MKYCVKIKEDNQVIGTWVYTKIIKILLKLHVSLSTLTNKYELDKFIMARIYI